MDLHDVVALLPERAGDRPVTVHRDVHDGYPDTEVLHIRDDLREILLGADQQHVADGAVPGQGGEVAVDLGLDSLALSRPHPAKPQLEAGQVGERVVLGGPAPVNGRLIPVAAQQLEPGPVSGHAREELKQPGVVPGNGLSVAGSVGGHRTIGEYIAGVHEQRAAVHPTPSFLDARRFQCPSPPIPRVWVAACGRSPGYSSPLTA
jgi:hypothetical protein